MPIISNVIKFYPPPDNCESCWKERKKFFRAILPNIKYTGRQLSIQIIGSCETEKKDKLEKFLRAELNKMRKGWVRIVFEQM